MDLYMRFCCGRASTRSLGLMVNIVDLTTEPVFVIKERCVWVMDGHGLQPAMSLTQKSGELPLRSVA